MRYINEFVVVQQFAPFYSMVPKFIVLMPETVELSKLVSTIKILVVSQGKVILDWI